MDIKFDKVGTAFISYWKTFDNLGFSSGTFQDSMSSEIQIMCFHFARHTWASSCQAFIIQVIQLKEKKISVFFSRNSLYSKGR